MVGSSVGLAFEESLQERRYARVVRLAQPEDRLLLELLVGLGPGDLEELIHRRPLVPLGVDEDELLLHLPAGHLLVQGEELGARDVRLAGPEQRLLAQLDVLVHVAGYPEQPALALPSLYLGHVEENLVARLGVPELGEQGLEEAHPVGIVALADPEDRLLAEVAGDAGAEREVAQRLASPRRILLGQGENGRVL